MASLAPTHPYPLFTLRFSHSLVSTGPKTCRCHIFPMSGFCNVSDLNQQLPLSRCKVDLFINRSRRSTSTPHHHALPYNLNDTKNIQKINCERNPIWAICSVGGETRLLQGAPITGHIIMATVRPTQKSWNKGAGGRRRSQSQRGSLSSPPDALPNRHLQTLCKQIEFIFPWNLSSEGMSEGTSRNS